MGIIRNTEEVRAIRENHMPFRQRLKANDIVKEFFNAPFPHIKRHYRKHAKEWGMDKDDPKGFDQYKQDIQGTINSKSSRIFISKDNLGREQNALVSRKGEILILRGGELRTFFKPKDIKKKLTTWCSPTRRDQQWIEIKR